MKNKKEVVIIGGGLGGIATAIFLSQRNFKITIIEKNENIGGKMNFFTKNGYSFDTGPSLITIPYIFENMFSKVGEKMSDHLDLIKINPLFKYIFSNSDIIYDSNFSLIEKNVNNKNYKELDNFYDFMTKASKLYNLSENTFFKNEIFSAPSTKDLKTLLRSPFTLFFKKYSDLVNKTFKDHRLRKIFLRYPTYVGASPYKSQSILSIIPFMELSFGGWYTRGGLYKIIESLEKILISNGVKIILNKKVSSINIKNKKIESVVLEQEENISADIVVSNVDPIITKTMLDKNFRLSEKNLSMSGLVFLVGVEKKIDKLHHHNVIFSDDYENEFREIFEKNIFPSDPTIYINCPTKTDKSLAPEQCESVFIMCNAPANKRIWGESEIKEAFNKVYAKLKSKNLSDIIDKSNFIKTITPNDLEKKFAAPFGSIYGKVSHGISGTVFRQPNKDSKINGLYYVGGGVHPGGGTPTVIMSGEIAANRIIRDYAKG
ncbi:MAG: phytoene desaturase family protein [Dehalococcoidia bacterium]|nr:phytoene desaturase family protein [Dehalococcoidia bacterium]